MLACVVSLCGAESGIYPLVLAGNNPASSMAIRLFEPVADTKSPPPPKKVYVQRDGDKGWLPAEVSLSTWSAGQVRVYHVDLHDLSANTRYHIKVGTEHAWHFSTMPDPDVAAVKIAIASDFYNIYDTASFINMCRSVALAEPHLIIGGGNYICGGVANASPSHWLHFVQRWSQLMRTSADDLIPLDPMPGSRDIEQATAAKQSNYYQIFGGRCFAHLLTIGRSATFVVLDAGVVAPIEGEQSTWLAKALMGARTTPYKFAVYQRSNRDKVHQWWLHLFEAHGIAAVFEQQNKCFSRSWPLLRDKRNLQGMFFCGCSCWGDLPKSSAYNYPNALFPFVEAVNGVWLLEIMKLGCVLRAIDMDGQELNRCALKAKGASHTASIGTVQAGMHGSREADKHPSR